MIDDKRVFISDIKDVNSMGVLLNKLKILMIPLTVRSYFMYSLLSCTMHFSSLISLIFAFFSDARKILK